VILPKDTFAVGAVETNGANDVGARYAGIIKAPIVDKAGMATSTMAAWMRDSSQDTATLIERVDHIPQPVAVDAFKTIAPPGQPSIVAVGLDTLIPESLGGIEITSDPMNRKLFFRNTAIVPPPMFGVSADDALLGLPIPGPPGSQGTPGPAGITLPAMASDEAVSVSVPGTGGGSSPTTDNSWIPLSLGVEPLQFVSDGAGRAILVAYP
jgi:hypothetical protein